MSTSPSRRRRASSAVYLIYREKSALHLLFSNKIIILFLQSQLFFFPQRIEFHIQITIGATRRDGKTLEQFLGYPGAPRLLRLCKSHDEFKVKSSNENISVKASFFENTISIFARKCLVFIQSFFRG